MALTHILEFSRDPLSDTTPTWTDISAYMLDAGSTLGVDGDLAEPQPGTATFRLDNRDRRFEPEYAAGTYFPDIVPLRRIRWRINDGSTTFDIFYGYVVDWGPSWPDGGINQEAVVKAVDGFELLSLDSLSLMDPPSASSLEEVIMHDQPFAYYKNGEKAGTKMEPVTGPEGVYKATPSLGQDGLIVGEASSSVRFSTASSEHATITVDTGKFADTNQISMECWANPDTIDDYQVMGFASAALEIASGLWFFNTLAGSDAEAAAAATEGQTDHVVATYDGQTARIYVNGVLSGQGESFPTSLTGVTTLYVGRSSAGGLSFDGRLQHVAFYEHVLTPERIAVHYAAGAGGFPEQTGGERVEAVVTNDLWAETDIQTGALMVQPIMEHGQSRVDAIRDAVKAELGLFYFKGQGDPRYLGWDYRGASPYNSSAATFGNSTGEVPFEDIQIAYDDEMFNEVTVTHQTTSEGEASHTMMDAASQLAYRRRAMPPYDVTLVHHTDAEAVAGAILQDHANPQVRIDSLSFTNTDTTAQTQILTRLPGDLIRVKHRPKGGTAIDIITHIRGRKLRLNPADASGSARVLECDWNLARGFDATDAVWRLSMVGYSELNTGTVLG